MLIYHPAYDAYHCTIRLMALMTKVTHLDIEKARILDFYLAFPGVAASLRLPTNLTPVRSLLQAMKNVYRDPVSAARTFAEMRQVQFSALNCLAAAGIVDVNKLQSGIVQRTGSPLPNAIESAVNDYIEHEDEILKILAENIANIPTAGPNGLKDRSGLLEYRYDHV